MNVRPVLLNGVEIDRDVSALGFGTHLEHMLRNQMIRSWCEKHARFRTMDGHYGRFNIEGLWNYGVTSSKTQSSPGFCFLFRQPRCR